MPTKMQELLIVVNKKRWDGTYIFEDTSKLFGKRSLKLDPWLDLSRGDTPSIVDLYQV